MALLVGSSIARFITSRSDKGSLYPGVHNSQHEKHGPIPLIASPVSPKAYNWLRRKEIEPKSHGPVAGKVKRSATVRDFEEEHSDSNLAEHIFRKQDAATSVELFFDLFFVGEFQHYRLQMNMS